MRERKELVRHHPRERHSSYLDSTSIGKIARDGQGSYIRERLGSSALQGPKARPIPALAEGQGGAVDTGLRAEGPIYSSGAVETSELLPTWIGLSALNSANAGTQACGLGWYRTHLWC